MSTPGSNLLRQALKVIKPTGIKYVKFKSRILNDARQYVNEYEEPKYFRASVQAINRSKYQILGLDFQKNYIKIWVSESLIDLARDYSGDYFIYGGRKYQLIDQTNWKLQDGWCSALAVDVGSEND